jgi:hypothetical protein
MALSLSPNASASPTKVAAGPAVADEEIVHLNLPEPLGSFDKLSTSGTRVPATFRTQAGTSGLTIKQSTMIQAAVDYYVDATGGKQISYNIVDVKGVKLVFPTPKADSKAISPAEVRGCPDYYFCMWRKTSWGGGWPDGPDPDLRFYFCPKTEIYNWVGDGSYINNQTEGTIAIFYGSNGIALVGASKPAYSSDDSYDWDPVYFVDPC